MLVFSLTATATGASSSSKVAQAKKLLLVLSDLPQGWSKQKGSSGNGSGNFPGAKKLAACIGVPAKLIESNPPQANGPTYQNKGDSLEVQDGVSVFSSAKEAKAEFNAVANAKAPGCTATAMNTPVFRKSVLSGAGKGSQIGTITATAINPANFYPGSAGFVLVIPLKVQGVSLNISFAVVYYVKGALGQQIQFTSYGATFPSSLTSTLSAVAAHRL
jgi:hypothetical protein